VQTSSVLSQPALVLNRSWLAIHTVPVRHALCLMFKGSAKAVQPETYEVHGFDSWADLAVTPDEPCIRSVCLKIRVPEVIVLTRHDGIPEPSAVFNRRNLFRRDHNTCQYCGSRPGTSELSIDPSSPALWPDAARGRTARSRARTATTARAGARRPRRG
jgi:hypothetical protein